ncbi:RNA polymerase sigma factor (sigma-70 family) [Spinactinospora alkalitolerans]|uniref:RNA polymerase sigma factor (Sigma-70 family) n=1 Tax=Spinactinospora alkalitolerans TaxID=687207 RepID=A0A852U0Q8_9ACTN|nr:sigma factor-like helix-turn-helix DNA-binding protein [Spinactinospora alkalitolerans]NYE47590.1 RNA polymerase sigma factor (sigma-70 family) [Spinactinospora alkalitolerans]
METSGTSRTLLPDKPVHAPGGASGRSALEESLTGLSRRERRAVVLCFFGHRSQAQIASAMGLPRAHVSRLLSRGLARMRADLLA